MIFTPAELEYLASQRLGRLATVAPDGMPQNNAVGFHYNADTESIDIGGFNLGASRKFTNVQNNDHVSLIVDDLASLDPWTVRGIEIRGHAEALVDQVPAEAWLSGEVIRIHPTRIVSWGVDPEAGRRSVPAKGNRA